MATDTLQNESAPVTQDNRAAWAAAVSRLKAAEAEYDRVDPLHTAAGEAAEVACPRRDEFFSRYNMGCGWDRDRNYRAARMSLVIERSKGRTLTAEEAQEVNTDAYRIVDDFETWQARREEAFREYDRLEALYEAALDERCEARDGLLKTPAPDQAAMRTKLELLTAIMVEADVEDAERVAAVRSDARRLLG